MGVAPHRAVLWEGSCVLLVLKALVIQVILTFALLATATK
jgi:hypothetical protein